MDADRTRNLSNPNDVFVNAPGGESGPSGYTEMNLMMWVHDRIAALFQRVRGRRS